MSLNELDDNFYDRADEHINLSNKQIIVNNREEVSASMMYSSARFNAFVSACSFKNADEMESSKQEAIKYFVGQYEKMFLDNFNDYIENFDSYFKKK